MRVHDSTITSSASKNKTVLFPPLSPLIKCIQMFNSNFHQNLDISQTNTLHAVPHPSSSLFLRSLTLSSLTAGGPWVPMHRSQPRHQPQGQGWPPAEHKVQPRPLLYEHPNPRAGFRKGKQKLSLRYRPPQAGPKSNAATVADVQFLMVAKCKGEGCKITQWPVLLLCTSIPSPLQRFCTLGVTQQPTPASLQAAQKCPGSCPGNKPVRQKHKLEPHCPYQPNIVPLSTITTSFNPSLGSYEVRRERQVCPRTVKVSALIGISQKKTIKQQHLFRLVMFLSKFHNNSEETSSSRTPAQVHSRSRQRRLPSNTTTSVQRRRKYQDLRCSTTTT